MPSLRVRPAYLLCCRPPLPSSASSSPSALGHFTTAPSPSRPRLTGCLRSLSSSSSSSSSAASVPPPPPFLFLVGGPCAGKGTQSRLLVEEFGREVQSTSDGTVVDPAILARLSQKHPPARSRGQRRGVALVHVSIGALLRREMQQSTMTTASRWSGLIHAAMQSGSILPGELTVDLLASEVQRATAEQRRLDPAFSSAFVIDGFPRSFDNVRHFTARFGQPTSLLLLNAADSTLRQRMQKRVAAAAEGRPDDTSEVMERRLTTYHADTQPVLRWWKGEQLSDQAAGLEGDKAGKASRRWLREVDGERSIEEVYEDVRDAYTKWLQEMHPHTQQPLTTKEDSST